MGTQANEVRERSCPGCGEAVVAERYEPEHGGVTWFWRCACGWSGVVTESSVVRRPSPDPSEDGDGD